MLHRGKPQRTLLKPVQDSTGQKSPVPMTIQYRHDCRVEPGIMFPVAHLTIHSLLLMASAPTRPMSGGFGQIAVVSTATGLHPSALQLWAILTIVRPQAGSKHLTSPKQLLHGTGHQSAEPSAILYNGATQVVHGIIFREAPGHKHGLMSVA